MKLFLLSALIVIAFYASVSAGDVNIRVNQAGYLRNDQKVAIVFSRTPLKGKFTLVDASGKAIFSGSMKTSSAPAAWG